MPFIIANEAFEKVASYGLLPNMIVYLMKDYGMSSTEGQNIIFFWTAATNFMPIIGALIWVVFSPLALVPFSVSWGCFFYG